MRVPAPHIWLLIAAALVAGSLTYEHYYSPTVATSTEGQCRPYPGTCDIDTDWRPPHPRARPAAAAMANLADHVRKHALSGEIPTRSANSTELVSTNAGNKPLSDQPAAQKTAPEREHAAPIKKKTAHVIPCGGKHKPLHKKHHKKHKTTSHHHHHHHGGGHSHHHGGHHHHSNPGHSSGHYHPRC